LTLYVQFPAHEDNISYVSKLHFTVLPSPHIAMTKWGGLVDHRGVKIYFLSRAPETFASPF